MLMFQAVLIKEYEKIFNNNIKLEQSRCFQYNVFERKAILN